MHTVCKYGSKITRPTKCYGIPKKGTPRKQTWTCQRVSGQTKGIFIGKVTRCLRSTATCICHFLLHSKVVHLHLLYCILWHSREDGRQWSPICNNSLWNGLLRALVSQCRQNFFLTLMSIKSHGIRGLSSSFNSVSLIVISPFPMWNFKMQNLSVATHGMQLPAVNFRALHAWACPSCQA